MHPISSISNTAVDMYLRALMRETGRWITNIKRIYRLYTALGLQLRIKNPKRRRKAKLKEDHCRVLKPNQTSAMDLVHDKLAMGKKIRAPAVVDIF